MQQRSEETKGVLYGVAAYAAWGVVPIYWPLLQPAGALELLAHRVLWSLVFMVGLTSLTRSWQPIRAHWSDLRVRRLLVIAALLILVNWGLFIWAVAERHVVDASLGYFITPLISVAFGVWAFGERLRRPQRIAFSFGGLALVLLTIDAGTIPWIGLLLATSFGAYGYVKKLAGADAMASMTIETAVATPLALAYLGWLEVQGQGMALHVSWWHALLVSTAGVVTAVPLLGFTAAAVRVPMSVLGLLQYIAPVLQFTLGIVAFHEQLTSLKLAGFILIWVGLAFSSADAYRRSAQRR